MPQINLTTFGGNLPRDPELRVTPKGTPICSFSIANNRKRKNEAGEEISEVTYLDVEAWGKTGELIAKFLQKGSPIIVWGRLKMDQWEDKQSGAKRSKIKLVLSFPEGGFDFCGGKAQDASGGEPETGASEPYKAPPTRAAPANSPRNNPPQTTAEIEDDIPF